MTWKQNKTFVFNILTNFTNNLKRVFLHFFNVQLFIPLTLYQNKLKVSVISLALLSVSRCFEEIDFCLRCLCLSFYILSQKLWKIICTCEIYFEFHCLITSMMVFWIGRWRLWYSYNLSRRIIKRWPFWPENYVWPRNRKAHTEIE